MTADQPVPTPVTSADVSRRGMFRGVAVAGLATPLVVACGDDGGSATSPPAEEAPAGGALTATADVPSGGGVVVKDENVVVTQPADGEFKAFTAICTHQGCVVADVKGGTINCNCHGSKYNIDDGSVANGPATKGLEEVAITVDGGEINLS